MSFLVTVKWFNVSKGFGFLLHPNEGGPDIFIMASHLTDAGYRPQDIAGEGTEIVVVFGEGDRGLIVTEVFEVIGVDPQPTEEQQRRTVTRNGERRRTSDSQETQFVNTLKAGDVVTGRLLYNRNWDDVFNHDRGYGFVEVLTVRGHKPIFVHVTNIPERLQDDVFDGAIFWLEIFETERGLAASVTRLNSASQHRAA